MLNRRYPNLDFETQTVEIRLELSQIYYFEVENSNCYLPNLVILGSQFFN